MTRQCSVEFNDTTRAFSSVSNVRLADGKVMLGVVICIMLDATLVPIEFLAVTVNVYLVPGCRPGGKRITQLTSEWFADSGLSEQ